MWVIRRLQWFFFNGKFTLPVLTTYVCPNRGSNPDLPHARRTLYHYDTAAVVGETERLYTIYALIISMNRSKLPKSFQFYNLFFNKKAILHLATRWYLTENSFRYWTQRVSSVYIVFHKWSFLYLNLCWCRFHDHTASENRPTAIRSRLIFDIARAWEHNQINSKL